MLAVLGVADLAERGPGGRLGRLGQGVQDVGHLVHPAPLVAVSGKTSPSAPRTECPVADGEHRGSHAPALEPRSTSAQDSVDSRCPSEIETSSLVPSDAHAHDDQGTQACLFEAHVEVDAVGVQ